MTSILSRESISSASFPLQAEKTLNQSLRDSLVKFNNSTLSSTNKTMNLLFPNSESGIFFPSTSIICISANSFGILSVTTVSNGKDNINEEPPSILFSNDKVP